MKFADGPVTLEWNGNGDDYGYLRWRDYHSSHPSGERVVYVHQLSVIADGADPWEVFSDGKYEVHHGTEENGSTEPWQRVPENNARDNLSVLLKAGHLKAHGYHTE